MNESTGTNTWKRQAEAVLVISSAKANATGQPVFRGEFYRVHFPFSVTHQKIPMAVAAFEKALVYFSLIIVLLVVAMSIPYFVALVFVMKKEFNWWLFHPYFIGQVIIKELAVLLGLIILPSLLLFNIFNSMLLLLKP